MDSFTYSQFQDQLLGTAEHDLETLPIAGRPLAAIAPQLSQRTKGLILVTGAALGLWAFSKAWKRVPFDRKNHASAGAEFTAKAASGAAVGKAVGALIP